MYKILCFLKKKPGMSLEDFKHHYETSHYPLATTVFPQIKEHRRNYLHTGDALVPEGWHLPDVDCISEIWFEDRAGFEGMLHLLADPEIGPRVREDELRFLDRDKCSMVPVSETVFSRWGS